MIFSAPPLLTLCYLLVHVSGLVKGDEDCYCVNNGYGSWVNCEISDQVCVDEVVLPFLQNALGSGNYGDLRLNCDENEPIGFPRDMVKKDVTFQYLEVWCGNAIMEPGSLGTAEATITEARIWLRQIPALHATQMVNLHIHKSNSLIITNDTFIGYHNLQNLEFSDYVIIESVEFGTFSTMPNLQSLVVNGGCVIYELGPGALYFNPGSIKQISLHAVDKIYPGAIAGIPKGVELHMIQLHSSDLSIEIFGGLLYGGAKLRVEAPLQTCACQAAWIVRDNSSMALNDARAANVLCRDYMLPGPAGQAGPPSLWTLTPEDFSSCP